MLGGSNEEITNKTHALTKGLGISNIFGIIYYCCTNYLTTGIIQYSPFSSSIGTSKINLKCWYHLINILSYMSWKWYTFWVLFNVRSNTLLHQDETTLSCGARWPMVRLFSLTKYRYRISISRYWELTYRYW